jgi:hypothetical protein
MIPQTDITSASLKSDWGHRRAEECEQEPNEGEGEVRAGLTVGRDAESQTRQMRQMAARGMAVQQLEQEELDGGHRRQHAVAPGGIASLLARRRNCVRLELGCRRCVQSRKHGRDTTDHPSTSCIIWGGPATSYRSCEGRPTSHEILGHSELPPTLHAIRPRALNRPNPWRRFADTPLETIGPMTTRATA